ncbi:2-dehydropantoate 2-reductase [uncultured Thiodictyon sp.]|uniref:2-dehydropantoate 2-reductase n=1 Tax=uncultured Thiodictyon sp. TaxID=1846217 RepID=UPI0025ECECA9|nr:2-dehydropantoate 2-reductase [uncultured Thiodictyon sp.]
MKICIVGAGAIGGLLAAKFARSGEEVTVVDRGLHLQAILRDGLHLQMADGTQSVTTKLAVTDRLAEVGTTDLIVLAVKAHQIAAVAPGLPGIYGPDTTVLTVQNGIPWWYFERHGGALENTRLWSLDPEGIISRNIPAERLIGCVAYPASSVTGPGRIRHIEGNRFPVGELDGKLSERAARVAGLFNAVGFKSFVLEDIRSEIWLKAWGALSFNPISALTQATMLDICCFPQTRVLVASMMAETQVIAEKLGISFRHTIERRITGAAGVGAHKTSMLQDLLAARSLEIDGVIGVIVELGRLTKTPCPSVDAIYACVKLLDRKMSGVRRPRRARRPPSALV